MNILIPTEGEWTHIKSLISNVERQPNLLDIFYAIFLTLEQKSY